MRIALIMDGVCVDCAVFDCLDTARAFLDAGFWTGGDSVQVLEESFGIGDRFADGRWVSTKPVFEEGER